jgi:lipopolysaccharide export system protein LptA
MIAITLALIFAGVVWWAMSRGAPAAPRPTGTDFSDAPDITDVEKGESIVLTLADRDDPTRVAGVIEADRLDPVGNGERLLTNPRAWLYMDNNRAVRVTADRARLLMPVNETPESGTLEGSVRVRVYESDTPGTPPADTAEPILTATFDDPVRFERRYMRLSSAGAFTIDSEQVRFSGEEMTVMLNEVRRRLESLDVARNGRMEISIANPADSDAPADEPQPDPQTVTDAAPASTDPAAPLPTPTPPKIDLYHTVLTTAVNATLGDTQVDADRLELFTRLTDNTLPPTAIARVAFAGLRDPATEAPTDEPDAQPTDPGSIMPSPDDGPAPSTNPDPGTTTTSPDPFPAAPTPAPDRLVLTWTGPMSIRPIDAATETPLPLAADDAALLLHADPGNAVRLADAAAGITAQSASLAYYATRAHLHLDPRDPTADTPTPDPVEITLENTGAARLAALRADLLTGRIDLPGPGTVASDDARIEWTESAAITLFKTDDDRLTSLLRTADFTGAVDASQSNARIAARALNTEFTRTPDNRVALTTATITRGSISAEAPLSAANSPPAPPRSLAADTVRVDFNPASPDPDPTRVEATGAVRAAADGATLTADHAVAHLMRDARNQVAVRTADAAGAVRYAAADDTSAQGDTLAVNAQAETVRITGPDSMIAQGDSTVRGPTINLDARARRMTVEGAGRFEHTLRDAEGLPAGRVLARWADSMRFDDALGRLNALGDVSVISTPDAYTRDTLSAQRIEVEITPQPIRDSVGGRGTRTRELHTARAFGDSAADSYRPATAETRRYDPNDPERVTGLLYLEGDQITADNRAATLRVPGAGTLLVMDRRDENAQPDAQPQDQQPAPNTPNTLGPGLTRFTWRGAFDLDRASGVAIMDDQVLVRHKTITPAGSPNASQIAELSTDTLTATFAETDGADNPFTLRTADAQGSVRFLANDKQLSADAARFEADTNTLHALALPGRLVELREPNRPAPLSARAIQWDLARDRIEINRPSPVTLPN